MSILYPVLPGPAGLVDDNKTSNFVRLKSIPSEAYLVNREIHSAQSFACPLHAVAAGQVEYYGKGIGTEACLVNRGTL